MTLWLPGAPSSNTTRQVEGAVLNNTRHMGQRCGAFSAAVLVVSVWVVGLQLPASARAQAQDGQTAEQTQEARRLFEEGLRFVESQQWQDAADRFGRVLAIRASAIVSYNYASALVHLNRMVEASRALRGVVADPNASPEVVEAARTLLSGVEPRIGQLSVRLHGDTTDVQITIDDEPLPEGDIGIPVPVDPGEHIVRATRGGLPIARRKVDIHEGAPLLNVTIDVVPLPDAVASNAAGASQDTAAPTIPTDERAQGDDRGGSTPWLWIAGGSLVVVGAAVIVGLLVASPSDPDPVLGNTDPAVLRGKVTGAMP